MKKLDLINDRTFGENINFGFEFLKYNFFLFKPLIIFDILIAVLYLLPFDFISLDYFLSIYWGITVALNLNYVAAGFAIYQEEDKIFIYFEKELRTKIWKRLLTKSVSFIFYALLFSLVFYLFKIEGGVYTFLGICLAILLVNFLLTPFKYMTKSESFGGSLKYAFSVLKKQRFSLFFLIIVTASVMIIPIMVLQNTLTSFLTEDSNLWILLTSALRHLSYFFVSVAAAVFYYSAVDKKEEITLNSLLDSIGEK